MGYSERCYEIKVRPLVGFLRKVSPIRYYYTNRIFQIVLFLKRVYMLLPIRAKSLYAYGHHHTVMGPHTHVVIFSDPVRV